MTENMIDITDHRSKWRDGDDASGKYNGDPFTATLRMRDETWTVLGLGVRNITDLRVTRPAPTLPEADGIVVQWNHCGDLLVAQRRYGMWCVAGGSSRTTAQLLDLIGTAEVHVATWTPLGGDR